MTRPSQHAQRKESSAWVRIGLELLDPEQRELVILRQWEGKSFSEIGAKLNIHENAARMRFQRALKKLGEEVCKLRGGDVE